MNDAPTVLEYEVTADDLRPFVRESRRRLQRSWTRRIAGLVALLMGLYFAADSVWLAAVLCLVLCTNYWFGWLYWLLWWVSLRFVAVREPYQCRIEVDERGLLMTATPPRSPQRFWWRSLRSVQDEPEGLELDFSGGMVVCIPRKAFATGEQYTQFLAAVNDHRTSRRAVAAAG